MARAIACDHCGKLQKPAEGDVWIETYHIRVGDGLSQGYGNEDGTATTFCTACSKLFLEFVKHSEANK